MPSVSIVLLRVIRFVESRVKPVPRASAATLPAEIVPTVTPPVESISIVSLPATLFDATFNQFVDSLPVPSVHI